MYLLWSTLSAQVGLKLRNRGLILKSDRGCYLADTLSAEACPPLMSLDVPMLSPRGLLTTLVYGGVRMKGQIQTQKYGFIKTVNGCKILFLKPGYHQYLLKMFCASSEIILNVSQLDKCLKFKSVQGDGNDCTLCKITPRNVVKFRHLSSCDTIVYTRQGSWAAEPPKKGVCEKI